MLHLRNKLNSTWTARKLRREFSHRSHVFPHFPANNLFERCTMRYLAPIESSVRGSMKFLVPLCGIAIAIGFLGDTRRFTPAVAAADEATTPTAKSIVDKAIEFHGLAKDFGKLALIRTEESDLIVNGEKVPLKCDWQFQPPDKRAFQTKIKIGSLSLHVRMGIEGDKGWIKFGPATAVDLSPDQVAGLIFEHRNRLRNVRLLATVDDYDMSDPSAIRIEDHDAWQIVFVDKKTKRSTTVYFDKKTGAVLGDEAERVVLTLGNENAREDPAKFRVLFRDYADVHGVKLAMKMSIFRNGVPAVEV
jgi:hypothetical protein